MQWILVRHDNLLQHPKESTQQQPQQPKETNNITYALTQKTLRGHSIHRLIVLGVRREEEGIQNNIKMC